MANLSGNAAQSAFQNLGGNIGDVGVAIGQLAEYAVDGNVKIGNIVKLAGPMLGLAAATTVLHPGDRGDQGRGRLQRPTGRRLLRSVAGRQHDRRNPAGDDPRYR